VFSGSEYVHVFEFVFPSRSFHHGVDDRLAELVVGGLIGGGGFEGASCLRRCVDVYIVTTIGFFAIVGVVVWQAQEVAVFGENEADDEAQGGRQQEFGGFFPSGAAVWLGISWYHCSSIKRHGDGRTR